MAERNKATTPEPDRLQQDRAAGSERQLNPLRHGSHIKQSQIQPAARRSREMLTPPNDDASAGERSCERCETSMCLLLNAGGLKRGAATAC